MPESLVKLLHLGHWSQDAGNLLQRKEVWKLLEGSIGPTGPSMVVDGPENLMVDHHFPHCRGNKIQSNRISSIFDQTHGQCHSD